MHAPAMMINGKTRTVDAKQKSDPTDASMHKAGLLSIGGILAALAAASCCVVPFGLFMAGISGAWISNLTALEPYQPIFAAVTLGCLGYGFYLVPRKRKGARAAGACWAK